MVTGSIIVIEDDEDDRNIIEEVLKELNIPNKALWFQRCMDAFHFLQTTVEQPFLIISDVNLPAVSGIEFKRLIEQDDNLRRKSIPFVFFTTSADKKDVNEVYDKTAIQGYFKKPSTYQETKNILKLIFEYWKVCKHPSSSDYMSL